MKVIHLSTNDSGGGAFRAANRLNSGLRILGHESLLFVAQGDKRDPSVRIFSPPMDITNRIRRRIRQKLINWKKIRYRDPRCVGFQLFSSDQTIYGNTLFKQLPSSDVINLHWINDFVDYGGFFLSVSPLTPLVWTIHDMNPFTGGCHSAMGCSNFMEQCGSCPQLNSVRKNDLSNQIWKRKSDCFSKISSSRLNIVTPSRWMANEVKCSSLLHKFPLTVIPNGVNLDDFAPRDRILSRSVLGVPEKAKVILYIGNKATVRRGFALLIKVLNGLDDLPDLFFLSLGSSDMHLEEKAYQSRNLGYISDERLLSLVYSAADIFVIPSLQDNFPNTIIESLACGTPVIGFDVGGIPDMVRPGITGLLAPVGDLAALREAIVDLLQNTQKRKKITANCRRIAVSEYSLAVQAKRYEELYQSQLVKNQA